MENKYSKQVQKNLKAQIQQISGLAPAGVVLFIPKMFAFEKFRNFFVAVGENSRLRWKKIFTEFVEKQSNIKEDVALGLDDELKFVEAEEIDKFIDRPFYGETIEQRFSKIGLAAADKAKAIFESGMKNGLGYKEILRNIKKELAVAGYQIERLIRTEGQRISNDILLTTYEKNKKNIGGIMYQAALDKRTCETCGHYDRSEYWYEGVPNVAKAPYVPLHPMCRCVYVPISKEWKNKTSRASMFGPIDTDYKEWLKGAESFEPGFAKSILGKNYEAWKLGKYEVSAKLTPEISYRNFLS